MSETRIDFNIMVEDLDPIDMDIEKNADMDQIMVRMGTLYIWFAKREVLLLLRTKLGEYLDSPPCDFCDLPAVHIAPDELGNDCCVCDEHLEMLANKTAERAADRKYEEEHKS